MPKLLKPYTIIPSNLYVHRDADRQVKNIIKDMGRPGYVLVSRQMGKTNLLLNAKRELESSNDVFVYIDLSNPFPTAKDCFENIIDTAIETNTDKFEDVRKIIQERRDGLRDTPAHKQHTNELRILLKAITGKLVIILDEIDALTKTTYSDQIFAQIRSIYFSRVNFKELSHLTYLLSGVIEPTEIIKDPKISPFNIGQKIFLNDFSKSEFLTLLENADINLSEELIERIYFWTNGNPRMTWDLCSEIENKAKHENINNTLIDRIVNEMYLIKFDTPPIDNIRELVKKDKEIRNAIIDIEQKNTKAISDKLKSKLYLSGIINYEENDVHIKNNIIRESLNHSWIKSLELEEKGMFETALTLIDNGNYKDAFDTFEVFLKGNDDFEENQKDLCYFNMTYALIQLRDFEKALYYSEQINFDKVDATKFYYRSVLQKGNIHYYLNNIDKSLTYFKEIINSGRKDDLYVRALLNYSSISLNTDIGNYKEEATRIYEDVILEKDLDKSKIKPEQLNELKSIAYYNLAKLLIVDNNNAKAKENLHSALSHSKDNTKPEIALSLLKIEENIDEQKRLIAEITDLIISEKISPTEIDPEKPLDFTFNQFQKVLIASYAIDKEVSFKKLVSKFSLLGNKSYSTHFFELAIFAINSKLYEIGIEMLNELYTNQALGEEELDKKTSYNLHKLLAYFNDNKKSIILPIEYLKIFENERLEVIDYLDFEIVANLIFYLIDKHEYHEALKYVNLIESLYGEVDVDILINFLVIYHLELNIYMHTKDSKKIFEKAKNILDFANKDELKHQRSNLLGDTGLDIIRQNAENIINPKVKQVAPIRVEKSIRRNDIVKVRYKDGSLVEKKFKKVENDIKSEKCFIISE